MPVKIKENGTLAVLKKNVQTSLRNLEHENCFAQISCFCERDTY